MPTALHRPLATLLAIAALFAGTNASAASPKQLARDIAALDDRLATFWPGYWPPGQPFVLYRNGQCVMRSDKTPDTGFSAIDGAPGFWEGRCDDARFEGPMVLDDIIAGVEAPAVELDKEPASLQRLAVFLLHEAFHAYQRNAFEDQDTPASNFDFPLDEELVRMKLRESSFLLSAADTEDRGRQIALVRAAVATRKARLERMPEEAARIEERYLRIEGTAEYISMRTQALVRGGDTPAKYLQDRLKHHSMHMGRTWEFMLRWQSYTTGAAAGLLLDRWEVDWKPLVAEGMPLYDILETASGYDDAESAALLEASAGADSSGVIATARQLVRNDAAAGKALARYTRESRYTLTLVSGTNTRMSFDTTEMHSVEGGTLVMKPAPMSSVLPGQHELTVRRPVRLWNVQDEEAALGETPSPDAGTLRIDVALPGPPGIEGCAADASRCGKGTRIRTRGVDLLLLDEHTMARSDTGLIVRQVARTASSSAEP